MLLKIGELAKHTGLTVRTLHHYDAIGLLKPSHRSDADYRLYNREDAARLHGIQTLRHLGLALGEIGKLLDGRGGDPRHIIDQQIQALDQEITRSTELRARLTLLHERLQGGEQPDMSDWLTALSLMSTYSKYFSATELREFFKNLKPLQAQWQILMAQIREVMNRNGKPDSPKVQPLVTRWIGLAQQSTGGDFGLMERWQQMYQQEPGTHGRDQSPPGDMMLFVNTAIELRLALLAKYLQADELRALGWVAQDEWTALEEKISALIRDQVAPGSPGAKVAVSQWSALMDRICHQNGKVRDKLLAAYACEPLLRAGSMLSVAAQAYIRQSLQERP